MQTEHNNYRPKIWHKYGTKKQKTVPRQKKISKKEKTITIKYISKSIAKNKRIKRLYTITIMMMMMMIMMMMMMIIIMIIIIIIIIIIITINTLKAMIWILQ